MIVVLKVLAGIIVVSVLLYGLIDWLLDYFSGDYETCPSVSWRLFKTTYAISPDRWRMDGIHPYFGYYDNNTTTWVRFSLLTYWRVMIILDDRAGKQSKQKRLQSQQRLLQIFQEDIDRVKQQAEREEQKAYAQMNPIIKRIREELAGTADTERVDASEKHRYRVRWTCDEAPQTSRPQVPDSWVYIKSYRRSSDGYHIRVYRDRTGQLHYEVKGDNENE